MGLSICLHSGWIISVLNQQIGNLSNNFWLLSGEKMAHLVLSSSVAPWALTGFPVEMWLHVAHIFLHLNHHQYTLTKIELPAMLLLWDKVTTAKNFYSQNSQTLKTLKYLSEIWDALKGRDCGGFSTDRSILRGFNDPWAHAPPRIVQSKNLLSHASKLHSLYVCVCAQ